MIVLLAYISLHVKCLKLCVAKQQSADRQFKMDTHLGYFMLVMESFNEINYCLASVERMPISVTKEVYWKPIGQALVYESSVPLVYKSFWPGVDKAYSAKPEKGGFCYTNANDPPCVLYSWILQVDKQIDHQITWLNTSTGEETEDEKPTPSRVERSVNLMGNLPISVAMS